jgi:hypothetical protein
MFRMLSFAVVAVVSSAAIGAVTAQLTWSRANLSEARWFPAATSVGNMVLVAGGQHWLQTGC